jgi:hypothetical protein
MNLLEKTDGGFLLQSNSLKGVRAGELSRILACPWI